MKLKLFTLFISLILLINPVLSCIPDWYCTPFSRCQDGVEQRSCIDINNCDDPSTMPDVKRICTSLDPVPNPCNEVWECTVWSKCDELNTKNRKCTEVNRCNTFDNQPVESQTCVEENITEVSVVILVLFLILLSGLLAAIFYFKKENSKLNEEKRTFFIPESEKEKTKRRVKKSKEEEEVLEFYTESEMEA